MLDLYEHKVFRLAVAILRDGGRAEEQDGALRRGVGFVARFEGRYILFPHREIMQFWRDPFVEP